MASGLSPVSLLDAAAGHLSANVVEIIKLLKIKRTVRRSRSSLSIRDMVERDTKGANGAFDREYGSTASTSAGLQRQGERAPSAAGGGANGSRPLLPHSALSERNTPSPVSGGLTPTAPQQQPPSSHPSVSANGLGGRTLQEPPPLRSHINSYQSAASSQARSDSFDLERKASVISNPRDAPRPVIETRNGVSLSANGGHIDERERTAPPVENSPLPPTMYPSRPGYQNRSVSAAAPDVKVAGGRNNGRPSEDSDTSSSVHPVTARSASTSQGQTMPVAREQDDAGGQSPGLGYAQGEGSEEEWEELKVSKRSFNHPESDEGSGADPGLTGSHLSHTSTRNRPLWSTLSKTSSRQYEPISRRRH